MDSEDVSKLYERAHRLLTFESETDILIEKMAEFTQAIIQSRQNSGGITYALMNELTEIEIACERLRRIIEQFPDGKMDLQKKRERNIAKLRAWVEASEKQGSPVTPFETALVYNNFSQDGKDSEKFPTWLDETLNEGDGVYRP